MRKKVCDVVDRVEHAGTVVIAVVRQNGISNNYSMSGHGRGDSKETR